MQHSSHLVTQRAVLTEEQSVASSNWVCSATAQAALHLQSQQPQSFVFGQLGVRQLRHLLSQPLTNIHLETTTRELATCAGDLDCISCDGHTGADLFAQSLRGRVQLLLEGQQCVLVLLLQDSEVSVMLLPRPGQRVEYSSSGEESMLSSSMSSGRSEKFGIAQLAGMSCVVDGTIPPSSGLSSSSALVCCAGLVTMEANQKSLSKVALAELCAKSERYIGTEGGGMDQSISFLAERGTAKLIEFQPLRATDVKLPDGAVFVISNCCVEMNKAASSHFNIRVVECRIATKMLAQAQGLDFSRLLKLVQVQTELEASLEEMLALVDELLHPEPYSREEICKQLGVTSEQFSSELLSANTQDVKQFKLHQRAKHVYGEAAREFDIGSIE
ncbi:N-acetylgalactosamine kinase [Liparis tanakae]|uniref:N-acetylgalactosamine kinase n=1 Tax=Liparis tanakae TaxID=230148 RepID=A0A4Z2J9V0_9TELE|nr:N-acetylgalactosamine kinase [Liparis tanakae]